MGHGRKWGERKGSPKFISAWGRGGNGASERVRRNLFRHGAWQEMGRAKGFAEIYFGMGCEQKRGDRNQFRSTGRGGLRAEMGERKGSPKFISAWVVSRSGVTEINFGQRAGAGRKWGDRNKFRSTGRRGAGAEMGERKGSPKFISAWGRGGNGVTEINFGQRAGAGRKWGDRNKFRSTGRRGAGAEMGERKGSPKFISAWGRGGNGVTEMNFGQRAGAGCGRKWGERKGSPKFISAWGMAGNGATEMNFGQRAGAGRWRKWGDRNKFRSTRGDRNNGD
jgi:hypothetical protein